MSFILFCVFPWVFIFCLFPHDLFFKWSSLIYFLQPIVLRKFDWFDYALIISEVFGIYQWYKEKYRGKTCLTLFQRTINLFCRGRRNITSPLYGLFIWKSSRHRNGKNGSGAALSRGKVLIQCRLPFDFHHCNDVKKSTFQSISQPLLLLRILPHCSSRKQSANKNALCYACATHSEEKRRLNIWIESNFLR